MKKTALIICLSFLLVQVYSTEPLVKNQNESDEKTVVVADSEVSANSEFFYPVRGFYFDLSPNMSNLFMNKYKLNFDFLDLGGMEPEGSGEVGFSFNAAYFKTIKPNLKVIAGIGFDKWNESFPDGDEFLNMNIKDSDDDALSFSFIPDEDWSNSFTFISVPVMFEFGKTNIDKLSFYVDLGLNFSFLMNSKSNYFSTSGKYGSNLANVEFENEDIPELGFYANEEVSTNSFHLSVIGGAGVTYPISGSMIIKGGLVTNIGMNEMFSDFLGNKLDNLGFEVGIYIYSLFDSSN